MHSSISRNIVEKRERERERGKERTQLIGQIVPSSRCGGERDRKPVFNNRAIYRKRSRGAAAAAAVAEGVSWRRQKRVAPASILQCKTFQRGEGWEKPDFPGKGKDIDGYGDLMAYCSTRYRYVLMSLLTLSDPCLLLPVSREKRRGGQDDFEAMLHCHRQPEHQRRFPRPFESYARNSTTCREKPTITVIITIIIKE